MSIKIGLEESHGDIFSHRVKHTDTQLVRDSARMFVSTMAHPLNRPYYDESLGRVTAGYGILQPRVAVSLPGANRSLYAKLSASEPGIDPYTRTVSDIYQDLFEEGSFIGKGIYDVDAFLKTFSKRFPDNRILSHDLLEGCYARSGLLTDVQLYEEYPSEYREDVKRRHRWIRGDWQIARWIMSRVPDASNQKRKNPLSLHSPSLYISHSGLDPESIICPQIDTYLHRLGLEG